MDDEELIFARTTATTVEHYLETVSKTNASMVHIPGLISTVNDSLFCARVQFRGCEPFVAEYPARSLIIHTIWGEPLKNGSWQHRIWLACRSKTDPRGVYTDGDCVQVKIFPEANFQHIFRSSLLWKVGY